MVVELVAYGGVNEIGGNKFLLHDRERNVRVLLDFGTSFQRYGAFFNEYLQPRTARGLLDALALGLIPPIPQLYRRDLYQDEWWEHVPQVTHLPDDPPVHGLLLSHGHRDHFGDVAYLREDLPIITTPITAAILRVMQVTGQSRFDTQWTHFRPRRWDEKGISQAQRQGSLYYRPFQLLTTAALPEGFLHWWRTWPADLDAPVPQSFPGEVAGLPVRWWPVDHSVPGGVAFALKTSIGWVAYTGDLRFHGAQAEHSRALMEDWANLGVAVLLCEGTRLDGYTHNPITEDQVRENALNLAKKAAGRLVVADFAPRNVERLVSFWHIARETDRRLALQPKDVALLEALAPLDPTFDQVLKDEKHVVMYDDPKATRYKWEKPLYQGTWSKRTVTHREVARTPGEYILCFSLWDVNDLLDLPADARQDGVYLYANSRAYDEEQAVDLQRLRNWIRHLGMTMYGDPDDPHTPRLHTSGHAYPQDLVDFVRQVRPRVLVPIHTEQPRLWVDLLKGTGIQIRFLHHGTSWVHGTSFKGR